jgi:ATP-dependent DNA ligase
MLPWRSSVPRKRSNLAPPLFIDPRLPTRADKTPIADGWVHEIKHDWFHLHIHARKDRVRLSTMTGVDWTDRYPWVVQDVAASKAIVSKRLNSPYRFGKVKTWLRIKNPKSPAVTRIVEQGPA